MYKIIKVIRTSLDFIYKVSFVFFDPLKIKIFHLTHIISRSLDQQNTQLYGQLRFMRSKQNDFI